MKILDFQHGRIVFSRQSLKMEPSLPDKVQAGAQYFHFEEGVGFLEAGFFDFDALAKDLERKQFAWLHLSGSVSDEFFGHLKRFADMSDEQLKMLKFPHGKPAYEEYSNGIFWSMQRPFVTDSTDAIENVNFYMTEKVLFTRQFSQDTAFNLVSHRMMAKGDTLTGMSVDRLAASLIDDVLQSYVEFLTVGGAKLESIQNKIIRRPGSEELHLINSAQQMIWIFLKTVWPLETLLQGMVRSKSHIITEAGRDELKFCLAEANSVIALFDIYRQMSYDLMDVYVSGLGLRTNKTTMILTVIATLFLPPSLIAGIYGMNFTIPEVHFAFGYYFALSAMLVVSGGLLIWLKLRGYIEF
ncbi:hypothetical protein GC174_07540 [bacterium]|nr:hypothetical protein [bacterium]